jgi:hypothetical protein
LAVEQELIDISLVDMLEQQQKVIHIDRLQVEGNVAQQFFEVE